MKFVLIVVWIASSQAYQRNDRQWLETTMQEFDSQKSCEVARDYLKRFDSPKRDIRMFTAECLPK